MNYILKIAKRLDFRVFVVCLLYVFCVGCSKNTDTIAPSDGNDGAALPKVRPFGEALKPSVVTKIGAEGGLLSSSDGMVNIVVPAGAVNQAMDFSVQIVTNTLENGIGVSYRILPGDVKFNKPIELIFELDGLEIEAWTFDLLYLAYQNKIGHHYLASDTELDRVGRKLKIKTTHFSDWSIVQLFDLEVSKEHVAVGDTAKIKLMWQMGHLLAPLIKDQPIGDLIDYDVNSKALTWSIGYGKGTLNAVGHTCVYTAPDRVPTQNPAEISVSIPISKYTNKRNAVAIMTAPLYVVPNDYLIVKVDGKEMKNMMPNQDGDYVTLWADNFYIGAELENDHSISIVIPSADAVGSYTFGSDYKKAYIDLQTDDAFPNSWISEKQNCNDCDVIYSSGSVRITKLGMIGDYVEGEFDAEVWRMGEYSPPLKKLEGKFRAFRKF